MGRRRPQEPLGDPTDPRGFEVLLEAYLSSIEVRGYSPRTVQSFRHNLRTLARWCLERGITAPREVTFPILQRYQRYLYYHRTHTGRPLSLRAQSMRLSNVRSFFRWLVREHHVLYNPASEIELPKLPHRLPHDVLTASEVETILRAIDLRMPQGLRDRAIVEVLYATGIRRMELVGLDVYDIDRERRWLTIREGKGGRDRVVPMGERALSWVERYLEDERPKWIVSDEEPALFLSRQGERLKVNGLTMLVLRHVRASGVRRRGSCHLFRHTMATLMLENGADIRFIQAILGHVKLETTQIYTRVSIRHLQEIHEATHPGVKLERSRQDVDDSRQELLDALAGEAEDEAEGLVRSEL